MLGVPLVSGRDILARVALLEVRHPLFSPIVSCMAALAGQLTQMSVEVSYEGATYELFWLLAGLICAVGTFHKRFPAECRRPD